MSRSDALEVLRAEIQAVAETELPAIGGDLEALRLAIQLRIAEAARAPSIEASPDGGERLLSAAQVADKFDLTVAWVQSHKNELPLVKMPGRTLRFSEAGLKRWIARRII